MTELFDAAAEAAVLGSMTIEPERIGEAAELLTAEAFHFAAHRLIFGAMLELYEAGGGTGQGVDGLLIRNCLKDRDLLEVIGGQDYLERILQSTPSAANLVYYAGVVKDFSLRRELASAAAKIAAAAEDTGRPIDEIRDDAVADLLTVTDTSGGEEVTLRDILPGVVDSLGKRKDNPLGIATGFALLDIWTGGLRNGELVVLAGRPSHGKTTFGLNVAVNLALDGKHIAIWSFETDARMLAERLLCSRAEVDTGFAMRGNLGNSDHERITDALRDLAEVEITFADANNVTPAKIWSRARQLHRMGPGLGCIFIDHLHLVRGNRRAENRNIEVGEMTRDFKALARELHIPVVLLAQLSRKTEGREDQRPRLSDLRDSGSIEQDADQVWMMYRPGQYDENAGTDAELIVAKNRLGQTGTIQLTFNGPMARFELRRK